MIFLFRLSKKGILTFYVKYVLSNSQIYNIVAEAHTPYSGGEIMTTRSARGEVKHRVREREREVERGPQLAATNGKSCLPVSVLNSNIYS